MTAQVARVADGDEAALDRLSSLKLYLETEIKSLIEVQRKTRIAASQPRYVVEGRTKAGYRGPRATRKRPTRRRMSINERMDMVSAEDIERVSALQGLISFFLTKRGEGPAIAVLVELVQLLGPLTGLDGSVVREDLPPESKLDEGSLAFIATEWGGRQDVDLVLLYQHHRATFEQIKKLLLGWQRRRNLDALNARFSERAITDETCREQECALRVADRAAAEQQARPTSPPLCELATTECRDPPGVVRLKNAILALNDSEQRREDFVTAVREIESTLREYGSTMGTEQSFKAVQMLNRLKAGLKVWDRDF